jgi:hypothetical protein
MGARTPIAWSPTSLDDFVNCPRAYYEKRIAKSVVDDPNSPHLIEGRRVHLAFEKYVGEGIKLPDDLVTHKEYLDTLRQRPGEIRVERKIALDLKCRPCGFFDKGPDGKSTVWMRAITDYSCVDEDEAEIVDYKTGKPHTKFKQLKLNALHVFAEYPQVMKIRVRYYWTKTQTTTQDHYTREMIPQMWRTFLPDLKQYKQAFNEDVWQPRPSGLCNGWCPVTDCEFWKPKRIK